MKFIKNTKYYDGTVYEWNLPTGHSCPHALECLVSVDRETGKFKNESTAYKCYAASAERFPGVRNHRWNNFDHVKSGGLVELPKGAEAVRIHTAGDFFSYKYFMQWVEIARANPEVEFWAYTKSLNFWVKAINEIPSNLVLTASTGGRFDSLIEKYNLKNVKVIHSLEGIDKNLIDEKDRLARTPNLNFYLLENKLMKAYLNDS